MAKIIVVTGQTATGKTAYAMQRSLEVNGEIVNADSRQVYKKLNIITGKDLEPKALFHHEKTLDQLDIGWYDPGVWLYDVIDPKYLFSTYDYKRGAVFVIKHLFSKHKTPVVTGGTYLYIKDLLYNTVDNHVPANWKLRTKLEKISLSKLQEILREKNTQLFDEMNASDRNNPRRLIRKIEIASTNKSAETTKKIMLPKCDIEIVGFAYEQKDNLQKAIRSRVASRLLNGAIEEVEELLRMGYTQNDPGLKTIGYVQLIDFLLGRVSKEQAIEEWTVREIQYAKRQLTFMKSNPQIVWQYV